VDTTSTYDTVLPPSYQVDNVTAPGVARHPRDFHPGARVSPLVRRIPDRKGVPFGAKKSWVFRENPLLPGPLPDWPSVVFRRFPSRARALEPFPEEGDVLFEPGVGAGGGAERRRLRSRVRDEARRDAGSRRT